MNREIKFRAQAIASNKWLYGDLRHHKDDVCIFEQGGNKGEQVKRDTIGQFVGLKDKDGKEIYEGDIVEFDGNGFDYNTGKMLRDKSSVIYSNCSFVVDYSPSLRYSLSVMRFYNLVVIGNIHDNFDLLNNQ